MHSSSLGNSSSWLRVFIRLPPGDRGDRGDEGPPLSFFPLSRFPLSALSALPALPTLPILPILPPLSTSSFFFFLASGFLAAIGLAASNSVTFTPAFIVGRDFSKRAGTNSKRFNLALLFRGSGIDELCDFQIGTMQEITRRFSAAFLLLAPSSPRLACSQICRNNSN